MSDASEENPNWRWFPIPLVPCACGCGDQLERFDKIGRARRYILGHCGAHHPPSPPKRYASQEFWRARWREYRRRPRH